MRCSWCRRPMDWIHGHAACVNARCPRYGANQAECCDGETAGQCPIPSCDVAAAADPRVSGGGTRTGAE